MYALYLGISLFIIICIQLLIFFKVEKKCGVTEDFRNFGRNHFKEQQQRMNAEYCGRNTIPDKKREFCEKPHNFKRCRNDCMPYYNPNAKKDDMKLYNISRRGDPYLNWCEKWTKGNRQIKDSFCHDTVVAFGKPMLGEQACRNECNSR